MEQVKELLSRFQVPGRVGERAMEYLRLAEVRCCSGVGGATSTGLALICIEIACTQLGEPFDKVSTSHAWCSSFLASFLVLRARRMKVRLVTIANIGLFH